MALLLKLKTSVVSLRRFSLVYDGFDISRQIPWSKAAAASVFSSADRSEDELKAMYEKFLAEHGKVYKTRKEKAQRFKRFKSTLELIENHPNGQLTPRADYFKFELRPGKRPLRSALRDCDYPDEDPTLHDIESRLEKEQEARQNLENRLKQVESELEEERAQRELERKERRTFETQMKKLMENMTLPH